MQMNRFENMIKARDHLDYVIKERAPETDFSYIEDEFAVIDACFSAIVDLMIPNDDLHQVDRGDLATLINYLVTRRDILLATIGK